MRKLLLPDEAKIFRERATSLGREHKEAGKRVGEACNQSSETWHDNFEFEDANRAMQLASKRLGEIQEILNNAQVVSQITDNKLVNIGKRVKICIDGGNIQEYIIGGYYTPVEGRVGYSAPLIQSLLGKTEGDVVEIMLHGKKREIEVIEVGVGINLDL